MTIRRRTLCRRSALILDTDPRITEVIKWQAPTVVYKGNLASFYPKSVSMCR